MSNNPAITTDWADYHSPELVPKYIVNRYDDKGNNRFYYFRDEQGQLQAAAGITTWLSQVMPESKFLTDWKLKWGKDWQHVLNLTSEYGTTMHACFAYMMKKEKIPAELINLAYDQTKALQRYDKTIPSNMIDKNIISFQRFMQEFKLKPLLIEALLVCRSDSGHFYCLTQDLLAEIEVETKEKTEVQEGHYMKGKNKGQPKMVTKIKRTQKTETVCIDFKSNPFDKDKKSFFDSHLYQLIGTKKAVMQNFGIKVDRLYNWSPNSWRSTVGDYTLHEWKPDQNDTDLFNIYELLATKRGLFTPKGKIEVFKDWEPGIKAEEMYESREYLEHIKKLEGI